MYQVKIENMAMTFESMEEAAGFCKTFMEHAEGFVPSVGITYFAPLMTQEEEF